MTAPTHSSAEKAKAPALNVPEAPTESLVTDPSPTAVMQCETGDPDRGPVGEGSVTRLSVSASGTAKTGAFAFSALECVGAFIAQVV